MSCKEIAENVNYSTELLREVKTINCRYFVILLALSLVLSLAFGYIIYDRYLDSQFEIEATTATEVIQDGCGYNSYIHGIGDIYNGSESKEDYDNEVQGQ